MAKGLAIKFNSYERSVHKILELVNLQKELKKYDNIVIKVPLNPDSENKLSINFVDSVLSFIMAHKNPVSSVYIAEGSDGADTMDLFENEGYSSLSEKYGVGLLDLNTSETEEIRDSEFLQFEEIYYPKILLNSFIISLAKTGVSNSTVIEGSLFNMIGTYPASHYKGFFSKGKSKLKRYNIKHLIHDILKCKMPDFAVIDASTEGMVLAGLPLEMDKQIARLLNLEWRNIPYLRLLDEALPSIKEEKPQESIRETLA